MKLRHESYIEHKLLNYKDDMETPTWMGATTHAPYGLDKSFKHLE